MKMTIKENFSLNQLHHTRLFFVVVIECCEIKAQIMRCHVHSNFVHVKVFNPTRGRGADSARPEEKLRFWYIKCRELKYLESLKE